LQSAIFNSANFSSIATDAKGVIQIFNAGAERMLGYAAADVTNKITPADISDPQELIARAKALSAEFSMPIAPGFEAMVFKASRGIEDIYELTYVRKDGSRFPAVVSVTALHDAHNAIIGYLLIATDNTARKQVEAEQKMIMGLTRDVTERQKAAEAELLYARVTMQRELVASVSHELGTPISAILASVETLLGKGENARTRRRFLRVIENHAKRLADIVKNLLLVAELESGTSKPVPSSIPLGACPSNTFWAINDG
jgi:signal transduction histidine kinase